MSTAVKVAAMGIIASVLSLLLRKNTPELSLLLALCAGVIIIFYCADGISAAVGFMRRLSETGGLMPEIVSPVLKVTGIAAVTRLSGDFCRDAKESALASAVELGGTMLSMLTLVPLMSSVLDLLIDLI